MDDYPVAFSVQQMSDRGTDVADPPNEYYFHFRSAGS